MRLTHPHFLRLRKGISRKERKEHIESLCSLREKCFCVSRLKVTLNTYILVFYMFKFGRFTFGVLDA